MKPGNTNFFIKKMRLLATESEVIYRIFGKAESISDNYDLCLTGYPRSANTYATLYLKKVFEDALIYSHVHRLSVAKRSLRLGIPTIVLYRNPIDAISSTVIKLSSSPVINRSEIKENTLYWGRYYNYLVNVNNANLHFISFDTVVNEPTSLVSTVSKLLDKEPISMNHANNLATALRDEMSNWKRAKSPLEENLPNEEKNKAKREIEETVREELYSLGYQDVYGALKALSLAR